MNKNRQKNNNYKKQNKNIALSTDSTTYESFLNISSVTASNKILSHEKNQNDKMTEKDGGNNPHLPALLGFNWKEFNYLQNLLNDDGSSREDDRIECSSLTTTSTSTITKSLFIGDEGEESQQPASSLHKLQYLMGLPSNIGEESIEIPSEPQEETVKQPVDSRDATLAMKRAENYLQQHKISQFFQFLTTHLLAAKSDKPIDFLIELLDECLIYRTGLGPPPLLYNQQHIEQLFYRMDCMKTDFIDYDQYRTGMMTLGIVNYCKRPRLSTGKMISKDYFIEEALRCLTVQLDGMIEKCSSDSRKKIASNALTPPPSSVTLKTN